VNTVDEVAVFLRSGDIATCERLIKGWKQAPTYQKYGLAEELIAHLQDKDSTPVRDYLWKKGENDRSLVSGRAKWGLEELLEVQLQPVVDLSSDTEEFAALQNNARALLNKRIAEIVSIQKDLDPRREELAEKYNGKINPGISDGAPESITAMQMLLLEWPPIGKRVQDLEAIISFEGEKNDGQVSYKFDTSYGGFEYRFTIEQGVITMVKIYGID
jgi:hypothetical protein